MHRENGGSEFRNRIAKGLRSHNDGGRERIRRAEGGDIPNTSAKKEADAGEGTMKRGGRVHRKLREHHSWGDFVSGLGSFMQTALPIVAHMAPMLLKKGGRVTRRAEGGDVERKVERKAAGGVGKIRHDQASGRGYID